MLIHPTRRQTLALGGAAALVAASGAPLRAQTPSRGGRFRVAKGYGQTTDTLDPGLSVNGYTVAQGYTLGNCLTEIAPDGSLQPDLAESWEPSDGGATWTFKIPSGLEFHDGRSCTSKDVLASMNHHRGDASTSAVKPQMSQVTDIETPDATTIIFRLEAPNADFAFFLTDYHMIVMPANEDGSLDWQGGVGTGPYSLDSFEPGVRSEFTRFANYHKSGKAWFDSIELLCVLDATARTNALMTGEVDAIDRVPNTVAARVAAHPNVELQSVAGNQHYMFAMHCDKAPYDDVNVRLALKYGLDRQEMVDKILFGYGGLGNDHPIGTGQRFYNDEIPQREYDADRARFHLKEAGLDGLEVELSVADAAFLGAIDAGVLYSEKARAAGIDVKVNRVPNDGYWSSVWLQHPFCAVYWGGRPTEDAMFTAAYAEGADWNDTNWSNARFNELLLAARGELDEEKRRQMYHEMQLLVHMDGGAVVPMFASFVYAHAPNVAHDGLASNWDMDGEKWADRWWFT